MSNKQKPLIEHELSVVTDADFFALLGGPLKKGVEFTVGDVNAVCMTITDDDKHLDRAPKKPQHHDDDDDDTELGEVFGIGSVGDVDAGMTVRVRSSSGEKYELVQLLTETGGTYWTFAGKNGVPGVDKVLTVDKIYDSKKVKYDKGMGIKFVAANDDALTTDEDTLVTGNLLANDCLSQIGKSHDDDDDDDDGGSDGSDLRIVAVAGGEVGEAFTVRTSDGREAQVTVAADGTITVDPRGGFDSLAVGDSETITIDYTAGATRTIGKGKKAQVVVETDKGTATIVITGVNDAPVAGDDPFTVAEDTALIISLADLLANDEDIDGDPLTVTLATGPSNGTLTLNADGTMTYIGDADFNGQDSFTYSVSDGNGGTDTATVTLTVTPVNDAPVAADDDYETPGAVGPLIVDASAGVLSNDNDVDGDTLTAALVSATTNGTLTLAANGSFVYEPSPLFSGPDSFVYEVSDGQGGTATATATITVAASAPPPAEQYLVDEDTPLVVDAAQGVLANDPKVPGQTLTVTVLEGPDNGTLSLNADGSFTYTPDPNFNGDDAFTYRVRNSSGVTINSLAEIAVAPVNDAPVVPTFTQSANVGRFSTGHVIGTLKAVDVDADELEFVLNGPDVLIFELGTPTRTSPTDWEIELIQRGAFASEDEIRAAAGGPDFLWEITIIASDGIADPVFTDFTFGTISAA